MLTLTLHNDFVVCPSMPDTGTDVLLVRKFNRLHIASVIKLDCEAESRSALHVLNIPEESLALSNTIDNKTCSLVLLAFTVFVDDTGGCCEPLAF
jgi:hypothetical protein